VPFGTWHLFVEAGLHGHPASPLPIHCYFAAFMYTRQHAKVHTRPCWAAEKDNESGRTKIRDNFGVHDNKTYNILITHNTQGATSGHGI